MTKDEIADILCNYLDEIESYEDDTMDAGELEIVKHTIELVVNELMDRLGV